MNIKKQTRENGVVFVVATIVTICFLLSSFLFVYKSGHLNEQKSIQYLHDATNQRQAALSQKLEGDLQVLRGVAIGLSELDLSMTDPLLALLDKVNRSNSFVRMGLAGIDGIVDLVDLDGTVYKDVDLSGMELFQGALKGHDGVSGILPSPATGLDVNYYTVPVYQTGEIVGVLCAANTCDILWDILEVPVFQGQGFFLIIDNEGTIVASAENMAANMTDGASILQSLTLNNSKQTSLLANMATNGTGNYTAEMDGEEVIITNQPLWRNNWHVLSIVPRAGITAYYNQTAVGTSIIVLTACLFFVLLLLQERRMMNRNQKSLETLAYTDMLTGVNNQTKFLIDAEHLLADRGDQKYAVWSFDINKFNNINDIFGFTVGDQVLQGVASVFKQLFPANSVFCRVSADLFAGLIAYQEQQELIDWSHRLWDELEKQDVVPASKVQISSAVGFYCMDDYPKEQLDISNMVSRASMARKQAKQIAKNEIRFFTRTMSDRVRRETELEASGRAALQHGEITFFLQPKVNIQNEFVITGAEVLARWKHQAHGWISPAEFIPLFEKNGFITEFDRNIFEQACKWYVAERKQAEPAFQLSINVSRQGLQQTDFLEYYTRIKEQYGIADGVLELEFTESAVLDDYKLFQYIVDELHKNGFLCAIDDFGSGYSSLNVLKNLTIDVLKLDAVFFRDGIDATREQVVIANCIRLARQLDIKIVAEGIEISQQVVFLQRTGCDIVQGYYFSKPLSPPDFQQLLIETGGYLPPVVPES